MKGAPSLDNITENLQPTPAATAPIMEHAARRARVERHRTGDQYTDTILGQPVTYTLQRIPHADIETRTRVWDGNERDQLLLTKNSVDDITHSFRQDGQKVPAFGREVDGVIEIAEGSRRRKTALITGQDYVIWVGQLTDQQMEALTDIGNQYREPSAWEKGRKHKRILDSEEISLTQLASRIGRDRKTITRELDTAKTPRFIMQLYPKPNDLSARAGQKLGQLWESGEEARQVLKTRADRIRELGWLDSKQITDSLLEATKASSLPEPRPWGRDCFRVGHNQGVMTVEIGKDVPADVQDRIENLIRKELQL